MTVMRRAIWVGALAGVTAGCVTAVLFSHQWRKTPALTALASAPSSPVDPWKQGADKVEEDRGEPVGSKASVEVPDQLRHYGDRRRFLAIQVAEWRKQNYELPGDYAELAALILRKQLVELAPVDDDYILFGAGESASDEPITHFDRATGCDIPLFANDEEYSREKSSLDESIRDTQSQVSVLEHDLRLRVRRTRSQRKTLNAQLASAREGLTLLSRQRELLREFQADPIRRRIILSDSRELAELATSFGGQAYDLTQPADRRAFKVRLLCFVRPEARAVLLEIARGYREKFNRPLPVTSLIRTEQYQRQLARTRRNAARIAAAPHTTGLAFDLYNHFMTANEQNYLMSMIAQLKAAGRVEALKETRDHIHVFAFPDGKPPGEESISQSLDQVALVRSFAGGVSRHIQAGRRRRSGKVRKLAREEDRCQTPAASGLTEWRKNASTRS